MYCVWLFTVVIRESENTKKASKKKEMTFKIKKIVNNNKLHLDKDSCDKQIEKEKHSRN